MIFKRKARSAQNGKARRRAVRKAGALPPDRQTLAAVYALGIRDGLKIAADIREKTRRTEGDVR
jgi:hypothetical protein